MPSLADKIRNEDEASGGRRANYPPVLEEGSLGDSRPNWAVNLFQMGDAAEIQVDGEWQQCVILQCTPGTTPDTKRACPERTTYVVTSHALRQHVQC